ncbi:1-pyrroline-5-carboxylate dehydrogenase [Fistulifera solaris]|uniref:1-pyrroline-5-carboxylate dehydrogenase n=1 Tax=Fistulifera solaris TaxID=1519565 RepID=A0A1Z5KE08_FISSO|nr:1-pyrroline-5-carboxylate dehydrogenase [Fistulifera solaris]|eukprot:GAX24416.1 1-pyrroline-5-carboxylate dehydrogenase [Fistulifera solaris]
MLSAVLPFRQQCGKHLRILHNFTSTRHLSTMIPSWATYDPYSAGTKGKEVYAVPNLVDGQWSHDSKQTLSIIDPLDKDKDPIFTICDTQEDEIQPFIDSLRKVPKSGLHNPFKKPERYLQYGDISRKAGHALMDPDIAEYFARTIMSCVPKSHAQALGEVRVSAQFLNNFGGDNVRQLARSFGVPGDHYGQMTVGHRWPFGPVAIVSPFNFPLEIPCLQLMGALFMGNKPVLKPSEQVSVVMEQFLRLLHDCGMDMTDVDFLNCRGPVAQKVIVDTPVRLTQFTGSSRVGELLSAATHGKVRLEDAGFDWKLIGPDVGDVDYVAWQCDQDAYASIGQKCSAQSICFVHENWKSVGLVDKMKELAMKRNLQDLTVGPTLTVTTKQFLDHTNKLAAIDGASILWGGKELADHNIPDKYGACEPTAVFVPLSEMMKGDNFEACATEIFAPFQVITYYNDETLSDVLDALERMSHHLTAAVVSNDVAFQTKVLSNTVNGTTYTGRRARTTGAPQNHWFGPAGDPRGAGIGTIEAIQLVWSCHREIIHDALIPDNWVQPKNS